MPLNVKFRFTSIAVWCKKNYFNKVEQWQNLNFSLHDVILNMSSPEAHVVKIVLIISKILAVYSIKKSMLLESH